jgi:hypothetical protein
VNACWFEFVGLLLSLILALFGTLMNQWARAYIDWTEVTPEWNAVALRRFLYSGIEAWHLGFNVVLLATLLQICAILFLSGPLIFPWNLDTTIAVLVFSLAGTALSAIAIVIVLPVFSSACPYKSFVSNMLSILASHTRCFNSWSGLCISAWGVDLYEWPKQITGKVEGVDVSTFVAAAGIVLTTVPVSSLKI